MLAQQLARPQQVVQDQHRHGLGSKHAHLGTGVHLIVGPIFHKAAPSHRMSVIVSASTNPDAGRPQFGKGAEKRVVVTGMGVVSSLGHDPDEMYDNLLAGKSGISLIEGFDASEYSTKIGGEIKSLNCDGYVVKKWEKRIDNVMKYLQVAGKKALENAGLPWEGPEIKELDKTQAGILIGTAMGGMQTFATAVEALETSGHRKMNPFCIPFAISNMGGAMLAMDLGFMGPNYSISTACATGNYCIMAAANHIRRGEASLMLAGGADAAIIPSGIGGFIACKALSKRNDDPEGASRPWDKGRDGFVMGEGCGVVVLEDLEHAKARGAPILAEFIGGAFTCDAHHMTEPHPEGRGVIACIEKAVAHAQVAPEDVGYVNAHGTSTPAGDMAEYRAITTALPHKSLKINSSKSMIGHLLGGASAVEAVVTIQALRRGKVHPNLNLDDPEDDVDLNIVVGKTAIDHDFKVHLPSLSSHRGGSSSRCQAATNTPSPASKVYPKRLIEWLSDNGAPQEKAEIQTIVKEGVEIDITVASQPLSPGDIALHIPEELVVTLDRIFDGDGPLAELLTTNKLSELAVLTLYLMYEKKRGPESSWYPFIKELDRIAGRGPQGAKSPLLWEAGQVQELLAGSPIVGQIKERLKGIRKEYEELDTVWYLSGALFSNYPFELPTEQFSVERFIQAFTAVQSSVVHLQGVALSKRFALVPMGPPLMQYSSTCKALLQYNAEKKQVQLVVDRAYNPGEQLQAWCGPQPNSRLLLNYGIVDDNNPYDKLPLGVVIPSDDPLYREKRTKLAENDLSTQQTFQMTRGTDSPLPENVLPYLRLTFATTKEELQAVKFGAQGEPVSDANEARVLAQLAGYLQKRLAGYKTTIQQDAATIANPCSGARQTVAARLVRIEKYILQGALEQVMAQPGAAQAIAAGAATGSAGVKFI